MSLDAFESRVNYDSLLNLLQSAADANMNMVRNWGGGIYQRMLLFIGGTRQLHHVKATMLCGLCCFLPTT